MTESRSSSIRLFSALLSQSTALAAFQAGGAASGRRHGGDHVFTIRNGLPVEPTNLARSFARIAADAKLRKIRLHDTRHGCATLLIAAGVPARVVMEILGHSQIAVTMNVYAHVTTDTSREAMGNMDRLLKRRRHLR
ncbi:integrase [Streptacidiphilus sp. MAP12-16]|uniref:tyrosine-type recombinase/integrase n=1 Tax=Streptacidiphilus sp. MAP12-16 TaxID=3156300 RepID=UPI0035186E44